MSSACVGCCISTLSQWYKISIAVQSMDSSYMAHSTDLEMSHSSTPYSRVVEHFAV